MARKQHIVIITTASLPWMTGTSINPLFRAAYLSRLDDSIRRITLVIPWLSAKHQQLVYPRNITFQSPANQEAYIRQWLEEKTGLKFTFSIRFYPAKFAVDLRSILPVGDISDVILGAEVDIVVLEEPEHLTWYHHGTRWKTRFPLVIGIIHTNYLEYVRREKNALQAFLLKYLNKWVVTIYCHKVIRLSAATQDYPNSIVCNVHGVNPKFLEVGKMKKEFSKGAYYIGKMVWSKGYRELLNLLQHHQKELEGLEIDLFGTGEDSNEIQQHAQMLNKLSVRVHPGRDHSDPLLHPYKVFVNPSTTDVVCTTTAEALAMGKFVICANHPSNDFFKQFPNCLMYNNSDSFMELMKKALGEEPLEVTDAQRYELSWEAATERFLRAAQLEPTTISSVEDDVPQTSSGKLKQRIEDVSAYLHYVASGFETARVAFGAVPKSLEPDEEMRNELGLPESTGKAEDYSSRWWLRS